MPELTFFVPGVPCGQPRIKASSVGGFVRCYTPTTVKGSDGRRKPHPIVAWRRAVGEFVSAAIKKADWHPFDGKVYVSMHFLLPRPQSHFNRNGQLRNGFPLHVTSKPDVDNLAKAVLDGMTEHGVWLDDAQVSELYISKKYSLKAGDVGCYVSVTT